MNEKIIKIFKKIKKFSFLQMFLDKKEKSLKNELKINKELIEFYNGRIKFHETLIEIHKVDIATLRKTNTNIGISISKIKNLKKV